MLIGSVIWRIRRALPLAALALLITLVTPGSAATLAAADPTLVRDVNIVARPSDLTASGGSLYFVATDGAHGYELWQSDGTATGTVMVKDINPGPGDASPNAMAVVNNRLYFAADDGAHGRELWRSDGSADGTTLIKDIIPGPQGTMGPTGDSWLSDLGGTLLFTATDGTHGYELWQSDGTADGTSLLKDINPGAAGSWPYASVIPRASIGGALYFIADDGTHGAELWRSDGTAAGTTLVKDINPASGSSYVNTLVAFGGALYFAADDGAHGYELWQSDGSTAGTRIVSDLNIGQSSATPYWLTSAGGSLFFSADDGVRGRELWRIGPALAGDPTPQIYMPLVAR